MPTYRGKPLQPTFRRDHRLASGLVGAWLPVAGAGTLRNLVQPGIADGIPSSNPTGTVTPYGRSVLLNGTNQSYDCGTAISLTSPMSVAALVIPTSIAAGLTIVSKGYDGSRTQWELKTDTAGGRVAWQSFETVVRGANSGANVLAVGVPTLLLGTVDGVYYRLYWNGFIVGYTAIAPGAPTGQKMMIGSIDAVGSASAFWPGSIVVVYLWNRILTDADASELAADPFAPLRPRTLTWLAGAATPINYGSLFRPRLFRMSQS
jgi:hypothetical protein